MITQRRTTESIVEFANSQGTRAQGTLIRLSRHVVVFEVYNPYSIVQLSEVLADFQIRRGDREVYGGKAVVTNLVNTGMMLIVSASLVDPWLDLHNLTPGSQLREEIQRFVEDWSDSTQQVVPAYKVSVGNIRNFLQELSRWLQHGETAAGVREPDVSEQYCDEFVSDVEHTLAPKFDEIFGEFEEIARQVPEDKVAAHKAFAQREIHPLMMCSPFMHRAFTKPLGYAGDYQMVNMILDEAYHGSDTYAKVVNSFPLRTDTARAHRNRINMLVDYLKAEAERVVDSGQRLRVLNIGCGPAGEVERFIRNSALADNVDIELVDFNEDTLEYAKGQIASAIAESNRRTDVTFTHRSVHQLLKQASDRGSDEPPNFDFVYCAGLFDYLNDRICGRLLQLFYRWTLPGGLVTATNVHSRHSVRAFMEHLQEWSLILRDDNQMLSLAPDMGHQTVECEPVGVNVFLNIRKPNIEGTD